jgi:hypothetical protein
MRRWKPASIKTRPLIGAADILDRTRRIGPAIDQPCTHTLKIAMADLDRERAGNNYSGGANIVILFRLIE